MCFILVFLKYLTLWVLSMLWFFCGILRGKDVRHGASRAFFCGAHGRLGNLGAEPVEVGKGVCCSSLLQVSWALLGTPGGGWVRTADTAPLGLPPPLLASSLLPALSLPNPDLPCKPHGPDLTQGFGIIYQPNCKDTNCWKSLWLLIEKTVFYHYNNIVCIFLFLFHYSWRLCK